MTRPGLEVVRESRSPISVLLVSFELPNLTRLMASAVGRSSNSFHQKVLLLLRNSKPQFPTHTFPSSKCSVIQGFLSAERTRKGLIRAVIFSYNNLISVFFRRPEFNIPAIDDLFGWIMGVGCINSLSPCCTSLLKLGVAISRYPWKGFWTK
jgi:hypothetical protein